MKALLITLAFAAPLSVAKFAPCVLGSSACPTTTNVVAQDVEEEHEESPLDTAMLDIEESLGKVRRAIRDAETYPDALASLAVLQEASLRAKLLDPPMVASVPEADRAAFVRDYRKMMIDMVHAALEVETALLDGDGDAAKDAFKKLRAFEDDGHEKFTEE